MPPKKSNDNVKNRQKAGPIRQRSGSDSTECESDKKYVISNPNLLFKLI